MKKKSTVILYGLIAFLFAVSFIARAQETCEKYGVLEVSGGEYKLQNCVWGADTRQCIQSTGGTGFTVSVSEHNQGSVAAYPSIFRGCHWGDCTNNSGMPVRVSDINSASFNFSVSSSRPSGDYNIAAECWLSPNADSSDGYDGGAEIMIVLDLHNMGYSGSQVGTFNGHAVYYASVGWNFVQYILTGRSSASGNMMDFINDAISRGYVDRSWYLHDMEAGFEIMRGGQGLTCNSFSFSVSGGGSFTSPPADTPEPTQVPTPEPTQTPESTPSPTPGPTAQPGSENGLKGEYYSGTNFGTLVLTRTDPVVDFNWGGGSPDSSIESDNFSIRWSGEGEPVYTDTYTFHENTDDGCRLYINNQLIIDQWNDGAAEEFSGTIDLNAGQRYSIRMEYYESGGDAIAQLSWSCNYQSKGIIPQSRLYSESIQPTPGPGADLGDVNGDGSINIVDALLVARYYVGLNPSNFNASAADTNCDDSVNIVDALLIAQYYVGLVNSFC